MLSKNVTSRYIDNNIIANGSTYDTSTNITQINIIDNPNNIKKCFIFLFISLYKKCGLKSTFKF